VALGDTADHRVQSAGPRPPAAVTLGAASAQHLLKLVVADDHPSAGRELAGKIERVEQPALGVLRAELRTAKPSRKLHTATAARELRLRLGPGSTRSVQLALKRLLGA